MQLQMTDREAFYAPTKLGKTRSITPDGFLLCQGVAIGRLGTQLYRRGDVKGMTYDERGEARIERTAEEVFRPESMASFEGKPVTVGHPDAFVGPESWKRYAVGTVHNVRRGEGTEDDLLVADLLITSADGIAFIDREMPETSSGYHADYDQDPAKPGRGCQRKIIGNHVALVKRGRAGPRCAIKDGETPMKATFLDRVSRLFTSFKAEDMAGVAAALAEETTDGAATGAIAPVVARVDQLATEVAALTQAVRATTDKATAEAAATAAAQATADAATAATAAAEAARLATLPVYTADTLSQIVSRAEILSPGIAIPTTDALAAEAPALMTLALTKASEGAGKECVTPFLLGRELKTLTGDALLGVFMGAAELARVRNNSKTAVAAAQKTKDSAGGPVTAADMNERASALWAPK
jgi:uncharacterized protein